MQIPISRNRLSPPLCIILIIRPFPIQRADSCRSSPPWLWPRRHLTKSPFLLSIPYTNTDTHLSFSPLCIISYLSDQDYFIATCIYLLSLVMFVFWPGVSGPSLMLDSCLGGQKLIGRVSIFMELQSQQID
jgi:hypothetical protein